MIVFLDGRFVDAREAAVPLSDRGFLYGDGVFETLRVYGGRPFGWAAHWKRMRRGAAFLKIPMPFSGGQLRRRAAELIGQNRLSEAVLRLQLTRGAGPRGYLPDGTERPRMTMTLHPLPEPGIRPPVCRLATASIRLQAGDPLAAVKSCNKLPQILARMEAAEQGADEALLLNGDGHAAEASGANLFWVEAGTICTPPLSAGVLPGVTRAVVLALCRRDGIPVMEKNIRRDGLAEAEGVFLTSSVREITEAAELDGRLLRRSPPAKRLFAAFRNQVADETAF